MVVMIKLLPILVFRNKEEEYAIQQDIDSNQAFLQEKILLLKIEQ